MLNTLHEAPTFGAPTPLERIAGDTVASLREHERWATSADALACYWDELFNAVCDRLDHLAERSTEPALQVGVRECVAALAQLHTSFSHECARHCRQALDIVALRSPRELL